MEVHVEELFFWDPIFLKGTPFEINRVVLVMFIASLTCLAFFLIGSGRRRLVPTGVQNIAESAYTFVRNQIAVDVIGPQEGLKYAPYLATVFFFIFFSNLFEIVPGIHFPVTSRMAIPATLALLTWIIFVFVGFKKQGLSYMKNTLFPPGVPKWVYIFLTPIELMSTFIIRPLTLAIRLLANMMAGHVLLTIFFLFTHEFLVEKIGPALPLGVITLGVGAILMIFELLVISIQAYIFTMLTAFYIAESTEGHGDQEESEEEDGDQEQREPQRETEGIEEAA